MHKRPNKWMETAENIVGVTISLKSHNSDTYAVKCEQNLAAKHRKIANKVRK